MKIFSRGILFLFILTFLCFRTDEFIYIKTIPANPTFLTTDLLGNFYIVQNNLLSKYDENGNLLYTYDSKNKGPICSVDASNPLKILVYYKEFNQIVFLDNTLTQTTEPIILEELGISQSSLACTSYGNTFWVFDYTLSRLVRFDKNFVLQNQSQNLLQALSIDKPSFMVERNNFIFLNNQSSGVFIFDKYGTYSKMIPIVNIDFFQIYDNKLFYTTPSLLHIINLTTYQENELNLPIDNSLLFQLADNRLYLTTKNGTMLYKTK